MQSSILHTAIVVLGTFFVLVSLNFLMTKALLKAVKNLQKMISTGPVGFSRFSVVNVFDIRKLTADIHFSQPVILKPKRFFDFIERIEALGDRIQESLVAFSFRDRRPALDTLAELIQEQSVGMLDVFLSNVLQNKRVLSLEVDFTSVKGDRAFSPSCTIANITKFENQILTSGILQIISNDVSLMLDLKGIDGVEVIDVDQIIVKVIAPSGFIQNILFKAN